MNKILIFGTGQGFLKRKEDIEKENIIVGFVDNYGNEAEFSGKKIYKPKEILEMEFDKIILCSMYQIEMAKQLLEIGVKSEKIEFSYKYGEEKRVYEKCKFIIEKSIIYFVIGTIKIKLEGINDFNVVHETFLLEAYNYIFENVKYIVLDIGANIGDTAIFFANNKNIERVYSYEPCKETYKQGMENIKLNEKIMNKIIFNNYGLGKKKEKIEISYNNEISECMSSKYDNDYILKINNKLMKKKINIQIESFYDELERIIKENNDKKIVIKIDCEGAEFDIFNDLDDKKNLFENIEGIMMEWHYEDPSEIIKELKKIGYKVLKNTINSKVGMIYAFK